MGLGNAFFAPLLLDEEGRDRMEDVVEWWAGTSFTLFFCVLAWLWKRTAFRASFDSGLGP
jgi:hypothetical protein